MRNPLSLGARKKPTLKHRPAIWECMLGTVYARNAEGKITYFDYDWDAAVSFAQLGDDLRVWRAPHSFAGHRMRQGQLVLYTN